MTETTHDYDVLVLGGGTAGTAAARAAAQAGCRTAMFNKGELGGLCILRGCMPTKTMLHAAHLAHHAAHHHTPGVSRTTPSIDFGAVMANKDRKVERFARAKIRSIENGGYEVIDARAYFVGPDLVETDAGKRYRFGRGAVIAVGSVPQVPPIEGLGSVPFWTSDDIMRLEVLPASVLVLGSGAIGLELAQFLARMGSEVTLCSRRPVFTDIDPLIALHMQQVLQAEPRLRLVQSFSIDRVQRSNSGIALHLTRHDRSLLVVEAAHLLLATGRTAALSGLCLEPAGVQYAGDRVAHDDEMRTTNERIFVAGDATGSQQLLHVANWEGRAAGLGAARVAGPHRVEQRLDMSVVFTDPPMARVGLSAHEAVRHGYDVIVAEEEFAQTGRAITMDVQHGAWKLVADRRTGEILGTQILGPHADDLVHGVAAIMFYRGTAKDMLQMPWYHPTISEVALSLARALVEQTGDRQ